MEMAGEILADGRCVLHGTGDQVREPGQGPLVIVVPGAMRGKGRPRFFNGRAVTDAKTRNSEAWIRHCAIEQVGQSVLEAPLRVDMVIEKSVPSSWSSRKKSAALLGEIKATGKPDIDNQFKQIDALNGIVWRDDSQIVEATIRRRFGPVDQTTITITPLA